MTADLTLRAREAAVRYPPVKPPSPGRLGAPEPAAAADDSEERARRNHASHIARRRELAEHLSRVLAVAITAEAESASSRTSG
jgi:hypothetical protein